MYFKQVTTFGFTGLEYVNHIYLDNTIKTVHHWDLETSQFLVSMETIHH